MKSKPDATVVVFLAFLAILYLSFLAKTKLILCGPQQFFIYHPIQSFWLSQLFNGDIPWINNAVAGGIPLWADPNLGIFYPGNLIYLVLPLNDAWNASLVFHLFWGQCGIYWLCRKFDLPVSAALTGAFVFLFSAPALAALNSNEVLITSSWVPWILGFIYFGLQQSSRKTVLSSIALSCQWLAGFTFVQAFTFALVVILCIAVYFRTKQYIIFQRFLLLISCVVVLTAIQWLPAIIWLTRSEPDFFQIQAGLKPFPYLGWLAVGLLLVGSQKKIVWFALFFILIDYFLFGGSPVLVFLFSMGVAVGLAQLFQKYHRSLPYILPAFVALELIIVNWHIPQSLPVAQVSKAPPVVSQIADIRRWNIHHSGTKGGLSPLAGLHWGLSYGTPPEDGLMLWKPLLARTASIENSIRTRKNLQLLRDARIAYVISDVVFKHPELRLVKQKATKFFVHRLRIPVSSLVTSSNTQANLRWSDVAPHSMVIESNHLLPTELTIYRNALPGWKCRLQDKLLPIHSDATGWMKIRLPAGKNQLQLTYRTPGAVSGTALTAIGTIFILAFLLL